MILILIKTGFMKDSFYRQDLKLYDENCKLKAKPEREVSFWLFETSDTNSQLPFVCALLAFIVYYTMVDQFITSFMYTLITMIHNAEHKAVAFQVTYCCLLEYLLQNICLF